jgi:hypothetical protein
MIRFARGTLHLNGCEKTADLNGETAMVILVAGVAAAFGLSTLAFLFLMWRAQSLDDEGPVKPSSFERVNRAR